MSGRLAAQSAGEPSKRMRPWLAALLLCALVALTYSNALHGDFVFDDLESVRDNRTIRQLFSPRVFSPPENAGVGGRPLANVSFAANYALGGLDPWSYRATNIALHAACALLLLGVVRRLLSLRGAELTPRGASADALAFFAAAIWAAHPLASSTVDYVSQRTELLAACAALATLYAFVRGATAARTQPARGWFVLAALACAAGVSAKETIATVPVVVFASDAIFIAGSWRAAWQRRRGWHLALAASWLLLGANLLASRLGEHGVGFGQGLGALAYARAETVALVTYGARAIWPHPLVFDYGRTFPETLVAVTGPVALCAAYAAVSAWALWRRPRLGFCLATPLVLLAPTSSFIPIVQQPIAESRMYLPLAVLVTGAAVVANNLLPSRRARWPGIAVVVALAFLTSRRNDDYATAPHLWKDTIAKRPDNARAYGNLGMTHLAAGDLTAATTALESALRLQPDYAEAQCNLGIVQLKSGRAAEALGHFEAALRAHPRLPGAHNNLGEALLNLGRTAEAVAAFRRATQFAPDDPRPCNNLGVALLQLGNVNEAIAADEAALQLDPDFAEAHYNLGNALAQAQRADEAAAHFQAALRCDPHFARAANNLGVLALRAGEPEAAIGYFEQALRLKPDYADARRNLEAVRAAAKR